MAYDLSTPSPGVIARHADRCPARRGGECTCGPLGYRAERDGRPVGPLMETEAEARAYAREGDDHHRPHTFGAALDEFLAQTADARELERSLALVDELEERELKAIRRRHLQAVLDRLDRSGVTPQRVEGVADSLREFFGWAVDEQLLDYSPAEALIVGHREQHTSTTTMTGTAPVPEGMVPDHVIWMALKIASVAFVLIALILVAESV
jgi:hypothetical protein